MICLSTHYRLRLYSAGAKLSYDYDFHQLEDSLHGYCLIYLLNTTADNRSKSSSRTPTVSRTLNVSRCCYELCTFLKRCN